MRAWTAVLPLLIGLWLAPRALSAHPETRALCSIRLVTAGLEAEFDLPLHAPAAPDQAVAELLRQIRAGTPSGPCRARAGPPRSKASADHQRIAVMVHFECPPGRVSFTNHWGLERDAASETLCVIDGAPWVFRRDTSRVEVGTPPRPRASYGEWLLLGARRVAGGAGQLLFMLVLLLAAVRGRQAAGARQRLSEPLLVVAGFGAGQLVTLVLAALGALRFEPRLIELLIGLSVLVVALENLLIERPRWRALNAALFGLVHGLGLAVALAGSELPEPGRAAALTAFALGAELALLAMAVLVAAPLLAVATRSWYRRRVLQPLSAAAALLVALWAITTATGLRVPSPDGSTAAALGPGAAGR